MLFGEPLLDGLEQVTIEGRWMLARADLAPEDHFAYIEPVAQEIGERASGEGNAANRPPIRERADFGEDAALAKVGKERPDTAEVEVAPKDRADLLGLLLLDEQLLVPADIAEWHHAADPEPLALGGADLVADPLSGDLALELGI